MADNRDPVLMPVPIRSLRPTQLTVGMIEVQSKRNEWRKDEGKGEFLGQHMIPVVIGPRKHAYIIDHHHLARALDDEGQEQVLIQTIANLEGLSKTNFWRFLDYHGWLHPFDEHGDRQPYSAIPRKISELKDDPFRSLAGAVRRAGGYAKEAQPFMEFIWADYFRRSFKPKDIRKNWDKTLDEAVALARLREAHFMPGWCGPH
jgi:hypothetical protein